MQVKNNCKRLYDGVDEIKSNFANIRVMRRNIISLLSEKQEEIPNIIKAEIDNRYLKFIEINRNSIIFKANKKFRDKNEDDCMFHLKYMYPFISSIFEKMDLYVEPETIEVIAEVNKDDNKIIVEF